MKYSEFSIQLLKERLVTKALHNRTPKKYSGDMFEAAEVIQQLQAEIKKLQKEIEKLKEQLPDSEED